jgi:COP9 signalosome complex subunit 1
MGRMSSDQTRGAAGDAQGYISNYTGHAKVVRLRFIAQHVEAPLELEALRLAADEVKQGENVVLYNEVGGPSAHTNPTPHPASLKISAGEPCVPAARGERITLTGRMVEDRGAQIIAQINGRLGDAYMPDAEWAARVERDANKRHEKLEMELNGYKTNLIKESIRMGHNDLGDFHYRRGDLQNAFKSYVRTRDYCTTSKHIVTMCLNVIAVSIELGDYGHVTNYVSKAEQTPELDDQVVLAKLRSAAGLAALENGKYKLAARKLVEVHNDLGGSYSSVVSAQDVATYGGLCALASFDRAELKSKVIDNNMFLQFLELVPEVRELIHDFYASRYASCLSYLEQLRPTLQLDVHLHDHWCQLYQQIRRKALIQYCYPFVSVDLAVMATAFNTSVAG